MTDVPYLVHESSLARSALANKRLALLLAASLVLNAAALIVKRK